MNTSTRTVTISNTKLAIASALLGFSALAAAGIQRLNSPMSNYADLVVTSVTASIVEQDTYDFLVKNIGRYNAFCNNSRECAKGIPFKIVVLENDQIKTSEIKYLPIMTSGAETKISFSSPELKSGRIIKAIIDPNNIIKETNDNNNTNHLSLNVNLLFTTYGVGLVDKNDNTLISLRDGDSVVFNRELSINPEASKDFRIKIKYFEQNKGSYLAKNFTDQLAVNGTPTVEKIPGLSLVPGEMSERNMIYQLPLDSNGNLTSDLKISVKLDATNEVVETDENNEYSFTLKAVPEPTPGAVQEGTVDFQITSVTKQDKSEDRDEINVVYKNTGSVAGKLPLYVSVNAKNKAGEKINLETGDFKIANLPGGDNQKKYLSKKTVLETIDGIQYAKLIDDASLLGLNENYNLLITTDKQKLEKNNVASLEIMINSGLADKQHQIYDFNISNNSNIVSLVNVTTTEPNIPPTNLTCNDTDDGIKENIFGKASQSVNGVMQAGYEDTCIVDVDFMQNLANECLKTDGSCGVNEVFCDNDKLSIKPVKCPYGCKNGACLKEEPKKEEPKTVVISCTDSDGGDKIEVVGEISNYYNGENIGKVKDTCQAEINGKMEDIVSCQNNKDKNCVLHEAVCINGPTAGNTQGAFTNHTCKQGCREGVCL